jgi:hypothetical protein
MQNPYFSCPQNQKTNALGKKAPPVAARVVLTHRSGLLQEKSCPL